MASAGAAEGERQLDMRSRIEEDREASELLIALFMSASMSYKYHSLVRPCPPDYSEMSSSLHESTVSQEKQREVVSYSSVLICSRSHPSILSYKTIYFLASKAIFFIVWTAEYVLSL